MKIAVTGASGLIGTALSNRLATSGHQVIKLVRNKNAASGSDKIYWDPSSGQIDTPHLQGLDAVVNLAGETVAQRWNQEIKTRIRDSRLESTTLLSKTLASMTNPPRVFLSASATGFYGDRGEEPITEASTAGSGFLAELCKEWEAATSPASEKGIRTVFLRTGIALSTKGGALGKMLPPFLIGAGGILGDGKQYMSWISMDDTIEIICFAIENESVFGPINLVAPNPVTNYEFTNALGKALGRPTFFSVPSFALKLLFGQMAEEMLLSGAKVLPGKLQAAGYKFRYPQLADALDCTLKN